MGIVLTNAANMRGHSKSCMGRNAMRREPNRTINTARYLNIVFLGGMCFLSDMQVRTNRLPSPSFFNIAVLAEASLFKVVIVYHYIL